MSDLDKLFKTYYNPLCNYANRIIQDSEASKDIVQNLFVQLWEKNQLPSIVQSERFLLRCTKFKCIDYLRTKNRKKESPIDLTQTSITIESSDLKEEDLEPLFYFFVAKLPPKTRELFLLSRKSGLSYKEMAVEKDISIKTVEAHMTKACNYSGYSVSKFK